MRRIHPFKSGIRALGIAESFDPKRDTKSLLAGVVMRKDFIIDGFSFIRTSVGGDDSTSKIIQLYHSFKRSDINIIMLSGAIISYYNIVDLDRVHSETGIPLVCLSYRESKGIENAIMERFGERASHKLEQYKRLGERKRITLKTGKSIFIRSLGINDDDAAAILQDFLLQGRYPEPIRVASLLASSCRKIHYSRKRSRTTS
ncbi:MAG: DUF99 family protein [Conexivisphaerales archaeon]